MSHLPRPIPMWAELNPYPANPLACPHRLNKLYLHVAYMWRFKRH